MKETTTNYNKKTEDYNEEKKWDVKGAENKTVREEDDDDKEEVFKSALRVL
jgi:hypothetical protein